MSRIALPQLPVIKNSFRLRYRLKEKNANGKPKK